MADFTDESPTSSGGLEPEPLLTKPQEGSFLDTGFYYAQKTGLTMWGALFRQVGRMLTLPQALSETEIEKTIKQPDREKWRPTILPPETLRQISIRWPELQGSTHKLMGVQGYSPGQISAYHGLGKLIPPVTDLIRMGVREAFNETVASRFGTDEDSQYMPSEWAAKQGLDPFWSRMYWRAHWELPSVSQGFEMLHRKVINQDTLNLLLRTLDIMPFWRDKLTQISYNPISRVDVRRMFNVGVLSQEQVQKAYEDIGYSPENSGLLTEWTVKTYGDESKELTKGEILKAVRIGQIKQGEAEPMLIELGYSEDEASFLIEQQASQQTDETRELTMGKVTQLYRYGILGEADATAQLQAIGYSPEAAANILKLETIKGTMDVNLLPLSYYTRFYKKGLIDEAYLTKKMRVMGYTELDIQLTVYENALAAGFVE